MKPDKYFSELEIELVKKKYYRAEDVDKVLVELRKMTEDQQQQILNLETKLQNYEEQKNEISEVLLSSKKTYNSIIEKANVKAQSIISDAEKQAEEIVRGNSDMEEYYIKKVEKMYDALRKNHMDSLSELNAQWQEFLGSMTE